MKLVATKQDQLLKLHYFSEECSKLVNACETYLIKEVSKGGKKSLYPKGTVLYKKIDPMVERGILATVRLFISNDETVSFIKVANIASTLYRDQPRKIKKIRRYKQQFREVIYEKYELFDRYFNVGHLHIDTRGERHEEQLRVSQSCLGPLEITELYSRIENASEIIDKFHNEIVGPYLEKLEDLET